MHLRILKLTALVALLALSSVCTPSQAQPGAADPAMAVAKVHEVRLRKLHLVRPDLIPFPVYFETYC